MVYDYDGQHLLGVKIILDDKEGPTSDINGRFILPDIEYGPHTIGLTKDGYESASIDFQFLNKTQVLYMKLASFNQLITLAEGSIKNKKWVEAERTLFRAGKIDGANPVLRYVRSVLAYKTENYEKAESFLKALLDEGYDEAYVHLLLADVYEFGLNDYEKAAMYLKTFLERTQDDAIIERLNKINEE